jgi:hypothetical protein
MRGLLCISLLLAAMGCGKPYAANIELRRDKQKLERRVAELESKLRTTDGDRRITLQGAAASVDVARLFTADALSFGRLTGTRDGRLSVYVVPLDRTGDEVKAAGGFIIEAFDLSRGPNALVGQWTFTPEQAASAWIGSGLLYCYVLECPLKEPVTRELRLRVVFQELLTARVIEANTPAPVLPR